MLPKLPTQVQLQLLSHGNYNNLLVKLKFTCILSCIFACFFFYASVLHKCFSREICVQYGGFPRMKQACHAAMPIACTVLAFGVYIFCGSVNASLAVC